jgi:hypothetical protein
MTDKKKTTRRSRIDILKEQEAQLLEKQMQLAEKIKKEKDKENKKFQQLEAKQKTLKRKKEDRTKYLMGSFLLKNILEGKETKLFEDFKSYLTRERDQLLVKEYFELLANERK